MCKCPKLKIKINRDLGALYPKGKIITVDARDGVALSKYWRDRIKDSEIDGCVTVIKPKETKK